MATLMLTVTHCETCPLATEVATCEHPVRQSPTRNELAEYIYNLRDDGARSPDWCPLLREPVTLVRS